MINYRIKGFGDGERWKTVVIFQKNPDATAMMNEIALISSVCGLKKPNSEWAINYDGMTVIEPPRVIIGKRRVAITQLEWLNN